MSTGPCSLSHSVSTRSRRCATSFVVRDRQRLSFDPVGFVDAGDAAERLRQIDVAHRRDVTVAGATFADGAGRQISGSRINASQ